VALQRGILGVLKLINAQLQKDKENKDQSENKPGPSFPRGRESIQTPYWQ